MDDGRLFKINVTPRDSLQDGGKLYFHLEPTYEDPKYDISFVGTLAYDESKDDGTFVPNPANNPYIAGMRADGLPDVDAVAEIPKTGTTLSVIIGVGSKVPEDEVIKYIKSISVTYAWVEKSA